MPQVVLDDKSDNDIYDGEANLEEAK